MPLFFSDSDDNEKVKAYKSSDGSSITSICSHHQNDIVHNRWSNYLSLDLEHGSQCQPSYNITLICFKSL